MTAPDSPRPTAGPETPTWCENGEHVLRQSRCYCGLHSFTIRIAPPAPTALSSTKGETEYARSLHDVLAGYPLPPAIAPSPTTGEAGLASLREHYAVIDDALDKVICEQRIQRRTREVYEADDQLAVIGVYLDLLESARSALRAALAASEPGDRT